MQFPIDVPGMDPIVTALDARMDRTHPCWPRRETRSFRYVLTQDAPVYAFLTAGAREFYANWRYVRWDPEWAK